MLEKLITLLNGNILLLARKFEDVVSGIKNLATGFSDLSANLKNQKPPQINVSVPEIKIPEVKLPDISKAISSSIEKGFMEMKAPEVKIADISQDIKKGFAGITLKVPEQKAPTVNIPAPVVNVNTPKVIEVEGMATLLEKLEKAISNDGLTSLFKKITQKKPVPIVVVDKNGELVDWIKLFKSSQPQFVGGGVHGLSNSGASSATSPIDGYKVADLDTSSTPAYYGFISSTGSWYILEENTLAGTYRYTKGTTDYATNWTARASKTYDYFNVVFG